MVLKVRFGPYPPSTFTSIPMLIPSIPGQQIMVGGPFLLRSFIDSLILSSMDYGAKKLYDSVALPRATVRVPRQGPLAPGIASVTSVS